MSDKRDPSNARQELDDALDFDPKDPMVGLSADD